jgi:hypothetical protein
VDLLIKNATTIALDAEHGSRPFAADISVRGDRIVEIGADLDIDGV